MAEVKTEQEPSIEEILESIRQIISDDGEATPAAAPAPAAVAPAPEPVVAAAPEPKPAPAPVAAAPAPAPQPAAAPAADPILDLTDRIDTHASDLDLSQQAQSVEDAGSYTHPAEVSDIVSNVTADAAAAAMAKLLANNVAVERDEPSRVGAVTLEDIVREQMKPILRSWLDQNLPGLVEKAVTREIEKIARRTLG